MASDCLTSKCCDIKRWKSRWRAGSDC